MDTSWHHNFNCVKCGRCVRACQEKSKWKHLYGGRDRYPDTYDDNLACHLCEEYCKQVCHYDAIRIKRC